MGIKFAILRLSLLQEMYRGQSRPSWAVATPEGGGLGRHLWAETDCSEKEMCKVSIVLDMALCQSTYSSSLRDSLLSYEFPVLRIEEMSQPLRGRDRILRGERAGVHHDLVRAEQFRSDDAATTAKEASRRERSWRSMNLEDRLLSTAKHRWAWTQRSRIMKGAALSSLGAFKRLAGDSG